MKKLLFIFIFALALGACGNDDVQTENTQALPQVTVQTVKALDSTQLEVNTTGVVKAGKKVLLKAENSGTLRGVNTKEGDKVILGQLLGSIYDPVLSSQNQNALNSFQNATQNLQAVLMSTEESIKQAQLGVETAKTNLVTAKTDLENRKRIMNQNLDSLYKNSNIYIDNAFNSVDYYLEITDDVLGINDSVSVPGLKASYVSAKEPDLLPAIRSKFDSVYRKYLALSKNTLSKEEKLSQTISLVQTVKSLMDDMVRIMDNTLTSQDTFTETLRSEWRSNFLSGQSSTNDILSSLITVNNNIDSLKLNNESTLASYESQVKLAELQFNNSENSLNSAKRNQELQILSAKINLSNAEGQLGTSNAQSGQLTLSSPLTGIVTGVLLENGDRVSPGTGVIEVSQIDFLNIEIDVDENIASKLIPGIEVQLQDNKKGVISNIYPSVDAQSKKIKVEIEFDNSKRELVPESFVSVKINGSSLSQNGNDKIYLIPLTAVQVNQNRSFVQLIQDKKIQGVDVQIGKTIGEKIEILSGLREGDTLVIRGGRLLNDGSEVEAIQEE